MRLNITIIAKVLSAESIRLFNQITQISHQQKSGRIGYRISYFRSKLMFYVIEMVYGISILESVFLPLPICTPKARKGSPCLQTEWLTHPAAKSVRGIRLPRVYKKCTTGKPARILQLALNFCLLKENIASLSDVIAPIRRITGSTRVVHRITATDKGK